MFTCHLRHVTYYEVLYIIFHIFINNAIDNVEKVCFVLFLSNRYIAATLCNRFVTAVMWYGSITQRPAEPWLEGLGSSY